MPPPPRRGELRQVATTVGTYHVGRTAASRAMRSNDPATLVEGFQLTRAAPLPGPERPDDAAVLGRDITASTATWSLVPTRPAASALATTEVEPPNDDAVLGREEVAVGDNPAGRLTPS